MSLKILQCQDVSFSQIYNMDIIADACPVFSRVICAKNIYSLTLTQSHLNYQGYKVAFMLVVFAKFL